MRDFDYSRRFHKEGNKNMREFRVGRGSQLYLYLLLKWKKLNLKTKREFSQQGWLPYYLLGMIHLIVWYTMGPLKYQVAKYNCLMNKYDFYMICI